MLPAGLAQRLRYHHASHDIVTGQKMVEWRLALREYHRAQQSELSRQLVSRFIIGEGRLVAMVGY